MQEKCLTQEMLSCDDRKVVVARSAVFFSIFMMSFLTFYHHFNHNTKLFFLDLLLLGCLLVAFFYFRKGDIVVLAKVLVAILITGMLLLIYINEAKDNVIFWPILMFFYFMSLYGHKKGLLLSIITFAIILPLVYQWVGISMNMQGFIRYFFIFLVIMVVSYIYEYSIEASMNKLHNMKDKLDKMTKIDSLTNLYNRRYFDEIFEKELKISKRNEKLFVFLMLDIDDFKGYNDTYGHLAGDDTLVIVAGTIRSRVKRINDYVFRLGGEEFGVVFSVNNYEDSVNIAKEIKEGIEELKIPHNEEYVTASLGMAIISPIQEHTQDEIFKLADDALYRAKNSGKNKVEIA